MRIVTLQNVQQMLMGDELIQLSYVYSESSPKYWRVMKDIHVLLSTGVFITIPEGFATDLSSSPRWAWSIAPPFGDFLLASLIHDYLYVNNIGNRASADWEMYVWSTAININRVDNFVRYVAVRLFGASWWKKAGAKFKALSK